MVSWVCGILNIEHRGLNSHGMILTTVKGVCISLKYGIFTNTHFGRDPQNDAWPILNHTFEVISSERLGVATLEIHGDLMKHRGWRKKIETEKLRKSTAVSSNMDESHVLFGQIHLSRELLTGWAPPVISWFINHYNPH